MACIVFAPQTISATTVAHDTTVRGAAEAKERLNSLLRTLLGSYMRQALDSKNEL